MADQPLSPKWKKPSDVMKLLRNKKKVSKKPAAATNIDAGKKPGKSRTEGGVSKRKNPFSCSPRKRAKTELTQNGIRNDGITEQPCELFNFLNETNDKDDNLMKVTEIKNQDNLKRDTQPQERCDPGLNMLRHSMESKPAGESHAGSAIKASKSSRENSGTHYPFDWSLRTKLRIIGDTPFSWCFPLRSKEETGGIVRFLREDNTAAVNLSLKSEEFQKCCMYYMFPNLPWLKLFPRMVGDSQITKGVTMGLFPEYIQKGLQDDWSLSFTSVYQMLRNGHCEYFYLCAHHQTMLFRKSPDGDTKGICVVVTPTSRGFRESLKLEEIEFDMPLNPKNKISTDEEASMEEEESCATNQNEEGDGSGDEEIAATNYGASTWLAELGLDKKKYRSLDPNQVKLQRDAYKLIDNRPESMVLIRGHNTHTLYNYLLNYKGIVAFTGIQTGIPPTILSSLAFTGATLRSLRVKQGALRQQMEEGHVHQGFSLEVAGPILPCAYQNILSLIKDTHGHYSASFSVVDATAPFNGVPVKNTEPVTRGDTVQACLGKEAVREIEFKKSTYEWNRF